MGQNDLRDSSGLPASSSSNNNNNNSTTTTFRDTMSGHNTASQPHGTFSSGLEASAQPSVLLPPFAPRRAETGANGPVNATVSSVSGGGGGASQGNMSRPVAAQTPARRSSDSRVQIPSYQDNFPIHRVPAGLEIPSEQVSLIPKQDGGIVAKKYATSVDERNFLTVYEYMVNGQWVIWDYYTGYVHLTGIWKAVGNSKADIVKLVDNSPTLEPVIRRVRGGYLKIQGTWLPFDVAKTLASKACYHIRYALIPIFGLDFPEMCLKPYEPGFGHLQLHFTNPVRRRRRKRPSESRVDNKSVSPGSPLNYKTTQASSSTQQTSNTMRPIPVIVGESPKRRISGSTISKKQQTQQHQPHQQHQQHHWSFSSPPANVSPVSTGVRWNSIYNNTIESSDEDDLEEDLDNPVYNGVFLPRQRRATYPPPSTPIRPPPMPNKLALADEQGLLNSPAEFLEVLQATRSLQQISVGNAGRKWSIDENLGGGFEFGGKLWEWDGKHQLSVIDSTPRSLPQSLPSALSSTGKVMTRPSAMEIKELIS